MYWNSARLTTGAKSTPASPASPMPIIHDTAVTPSVLMPWIAAFRGWSTAARVARPSGVSRRNSVAASAMPAALTMTTNWVLFT